jgi:hypothetical protein
MALTSGVYVSYCPVQVTLAFYDHSHGLVSTCVDFYAYSKMNHQNNRSYGGVGVSCPGPGFSYYVFCLFGDWGTYRAKITSC